MSTYQRMQVQQLFTLLLKYFHKCYYNNFKPKPPIFQFITTVYILFMLLSYLCC